MEAYDEIDRLLTALMNNQSLFAHYIDGINTQFGKIEEEGGERIKYFMFFLRGVAWYCRVNALTGRAETFLELPGIFHRIANMPNVRNCMVLKEDVEYIIRHVKKMVKYYQDGELAYVVEDIWMKEIFKALWKVHEEHLAERKCRIWALREELIAAVLSPQRAERIAAAHGMEAMDWLIANEGHQLEGW
jgi:hypothetical protein